ncbi:MAG TPA: sigma-54 dependent transcriptional regulator [Candidatus Acidoferrales bacterium]
MNHAAVVTKARSNRSLIPICVVDDHESLLKVTVLLLQEAGFGAIGTDKPDFALQGVENGLFRVVLVDVRMPRLDGFAFLEKALQLDPALKVILITGFYSKESATDAVERGAADYLSKPLDWPRLFQTLDEMADVVAQKAQVGELEEQILNNSEFHGIIGKSSIMLEVFDRIRHVAKHYTHALITGPSGSGKELIARALHAASANSNEPFVTYICSGFDQPKRPRAKSGLGEVSVESAELIDIISANRKATVYLDEVADMPAAFQTRLLSAIQNRDPERDGVRIIAATRSDLRQEAAAGRFREDLFYRLGSLEIHSPPLAERTQDISLLVHFFTKKYNAAYNKHFRGLTRRSQVALLKHSWPGNVRELENVIAGAIMVGRGNFVDIGELPTHIQKPSVDDSKEVWKPVSLAELEQTHIERVVAMAGNLTRAAEILGISRSSLYRLMKRPAAPEKMSTAVAQSALRTC